MDERLRNKARMVNQKSWRFPIFSIEEVVVFILMLKILYASDPYFLINTE